MYLLKESEDDEKADEDEIYLDSPSGGEQTNSICLSGEHLHSPGERTWVLFYNRSHSLTSVGYEARL